MDFGKDAMHGRFSYQIIVSTNGKSKLMGTIYTAAIVNPLYERDSNPVRSQESWSSYQSPQNCNMANVASEIYGLYFDNHFLPVLIPKIPGMLANFSGVHNTLVISLPNAFSGKWGL